MNDPNFKLFYLINFIRIYLNKASIQSHLFCKLPFISMDSYSGYSINIQVVR